MPTNEHTGPRLTIVRSILLAWGAMSAMSLIAALCYAARPVPLPKLSAFADARSSVNDLWLGQEGSPDEGEVAPEQVEKYIAVYKAMQRNHNLAIEQAVAAQGLSLDAFRDIEHRIERDDMVREHVRQALRGESAGATPTGPSGSPSPGQAK